jgi:hypothetical protein
LYLRLHRLHHSYTPKPQLPSEFFLKKNPLGATPKKARELRNRSKVGQREPRPREPFSIHHEQWGGTDIVFETWESTNLKK